MVVHRAGPLSEMCERISVVNGYVSLDTTIDEQSRTSDLIDIDDHEVLWTEWAKFAAWRTQGRLARLVEELEFTSDPDIVIDELGKRDRRRAARRRPDARPRARSPALRRLITSPLGRVSRVAVWVIRP